MSRRYKGGVISATAPTTSTSVATGVWTLNQQMVAIVGSGWPVQSYYWIGLLGEGATNNVVCRGVSVDSSSNMYLVGYQTISGNSGFQIAKYDTSGSIQWQRTLNSASADTAWAIAASPSGNVYVCGYSSDSGTNDGQIAKYNTSGAIQWQRRLGGSGSNFNQGGGISLDSSENVYICGYTTAGGVEGFQIAKYNTSGTIQWQRKLHGSTTVGHSVAVDSSGNVYVCGESDASGSNDFQIAKYNTSGTIQWQRRLGSASYEIGYSVAVDSSSNLYICGASNSSGTFEFVIAKYNTSGTIQWQRRLGGAASEFAYSVSVDSSGNVYVCGDSFTGGAGNADVQIAKYDTSGTIQWQRKIGSTGPDNGRSISVSAAGDIFVGAYTSISTANQMLFAKLPNDGSRTGTYTVGGYSFTYAASTLTDAVTTLTDAASSLTDVASTLTDAATTLTDAATTLTSSVTTI